MLETLVSRLGVTQRPIWVASFEVVPVTETADHGDRQG